MGINQFDSVTRVKIIGARAVNEMLKDTPSLTRKFVRSEMWRFVRRVRAKVVKNWVKGRPGIKWKGPTGRGKVRGVGGKVGSAPKLGNNIRGWVEDDRGFKDLEANVKISRFLRVHEDGLTINAKPGKWLIIRDPGDRRRGKIVALVKRVVIPARLHFRETFDSLRPDARLKIEKAIGRAADEEEKIANRKISRTFRPSVFSARSLGL